MVGLTCMPRPTAPFPTPCHPSCLLPLAFFPYHLPLQDHSSAPTCPLQPLCPLLLQFLAVLGLSPPSLSLPYKMTGRGRDLLKSIIYGQRNMLLFDGGEEIFVSLVEGLNIPAWPGNFQLTPAQKKATWLKACPREGLPILSYPPLKLRGNLPLLPSSSWLFIF